MVLFWGEGGRKDPRRENGSDGVETTELIVLEAMIKKMDPSLDILHYFSRHLLSQVLARKRAKNAFSTCLCVHYNRDGGIFWGRNQ